MLLFLPKKIRIYMFHMRSRLKKRSTPISRLLSKKVFLLREAKAFYRAGIRLGKPYLLHLLNLNQSQNNVVYEHHHAAVIVI